MRKKLLAGFLAVALSFSAVTIGVSYSNNGKQESKNSIKVSAADTITAVFDIIEGSTWNPNTSFKSGYYTYAVGFKNPDGTAGFAFDGAADGANKDLSSNYNDEFTFNGVPFKECGVMLTRLHGGKYLSLCIPTSLNKATENYPFPVISIKEGTTFAGKVLNKTEFCLEQNGTLCERLTANSINWNNIDYGKFSTYATYQDNSVPNNGYVVLLHFTGEINGRLKANGSCDSNQAFIDLTDDANTNIGSKLLVEGTPINQLEGATVGSYAGMLYVFIPDYVGIRPEIKILEGTTLGARWDGVKALPYHLAPSSLIYDYYIGSFNQWKFQEKHLRNVTYDSILGNNTSYGNYKDDKGDDMKGLLIKFNENLSNRSGILDGNDKFINLVKSKLGSTVKYNGIPFNQIEGAEIKYFTTNLLWLYTPHFADINVDDYIDVEGVVIDDAIVPTIRFRKNSNVWYNATKVTMDCKNGQNNIVYYAYSNSTSCGEFNAAFTPSKSYSTFVGWGQNGVLLNNSTTFSGSDVTLEAIYQDKIASFVGIGHYNNYNNGSSLITSLFFDQSLKVIGASETSSSEHIDYEEWGKHVYINDVSFYDLVVTNKIPNCNLWYYPAVDNNSYGYTGDNSIIFGIDPLYFENISRISTPIFKIDGGTKYRDCIFNEVKLSFVDGVWKEYTPIGIETQKNAEIKTFDGDESSGMSFETRMKKVDYDNLVSSGSTYSFGTYLIIKDSFDKSGYSSIADYIKNIPSGSKTYVSIEDTNKDFVNSSTSTNDGYYSFKGSIVKIKEGNLLKNFIPVGYVIIDGTPYYGQNGTYYTNFYNVLRNNAGISGVSDKLSSIADIKSTNKSHLIEKTYSSDTNFKVTTSDNGFYEISAIGHDINRVIIDGVVENMLIPSGSSKFVQKVNNKFKTQDKKQSILMGFAEPNSEQYTDNNTNSHANADNNSVIYSTFNGKCARIWLTPQNLLGSGWTEIGLISPYDTVPDFDAAKVQSLKDTVNKYRAAGVEDITLMMNFFVYNWSNKFLRRTSDNIYISWQEWATSGSPEIEHGMTFIPKTDMDDYNSFIDSNKALYRMIGEEFEGYIDNVEAMNEINLGAASFSQEVQKIGQSNYISLHSDKFDLQEFVAEYSMDYCKAMTDGIKEANSSIKVLTPAIAPVNNTTTSSYTWNRNGKAYLNECYKYIDQHGGNYNDYFQGINIHPYMLPSKEILGTEVDNEAYLYTTNPHGAKGFDFSTSKLSGGKRLLNESGINRNYAEDWSNYMDSIHNLSESYGDYNKPMYFTEYGLCDYGRTTDSNWTNWNKNDMYSEVIRALDVYMKQKTYIHSVYYFRMYDMLETDLSFDACAEKNYGVIEADGKVKKNAKAVYYIINGYEYNGDITSLNLFPNW